ncbi:CDGSH iron-sulfur domain-containing protein [Candidatus Jidaibacter acanthamoebae]|nr:CDGSH iron-sulfur domain-containing protein [Candidatus Jidaibacter acanthamoeba]
MDETLPKVAIPRSIKVEVKEGERCYYCTCGLSKSQPFCDDSHQGTGFSPLEYTADSNGIVSFCGCKHTKKPPFCDGAHKTLA